MKRLHSSRCGLHGVADLLKAADEAVGGLGRVGAVELHIRFMRRGSRAARWSN